MLLQIMPFLSFQTELKSIQQNPKSFELLCSLQFYVQFAFLANCSRDLPFGSRAHVSFSFHFENTSHFLSLIDFRAVPCSFLTHEASLSIPKRSDSISEFLFGFENKSTRSMLLSNNDCTSKESKINKLVQFCVSRKALS